LEVIDDVIWALAVVCGGIGTMLIVVAIRDWKDK
jgi:hypothetical protein